jgi:hypothetical protein
MDANGTITVFSALIIEVQLVRDDNTPWGDWANELAIVKPPPGRRMPRLSGVGIGEHLYIGTAPGNHLLAVSATKGGLTSLLSLPPSLVISQSF